MNKCKSRSTGQTIEAFIEVTFEADDKLNSIQTAERTDPRTAKVTNDNNSVILAVVFITNAAVVRDIARLFVGTVVNQVTYRVSVCSSQYHSEERMCQSLQ